MSECDMKLTVLVDNNTYIDQYYLGEPAVSYWIEADERYILFDTGYSDVLLKNAAAMGIDLTQVTDIVLSHGHNDHTRGLRFLAETQDLSGVRVITHPSTLWPITLDGVPIGPPFLREEMERMCRLQLSAKALQLSPHVWFLGQIFNTNTFEWRREIGTKEINGLPVADTSPEDSALVVETERGPFVVTGCSHSGICNIVEQALRLTGHQKVCGVIGGFHLFDVDDRLAQTAAYLKEHLDGTLYPCHCVSLAAKAELMRHMPVAEVGVGLTITDGRTIGHSVPAGMEVEG